MGKLHEIKTNVHHDGIKDCIEAGRQALKVAKSSMNEELGVTALGLAGEALAQAVNRLEDGRVREELRQKSSTRFGQLTTQPLAPPSFKNAACLAQQIVT